jgi:small subunit ribosomal protein S9
MSSKPKNLKIWKCKMPETTYYATGRRKTSIARVWLKAGKGITINGRESMDYLKRGNLQMIIEQPLQTTQMIEKFQVKANVHGGGIAGQAGAIRLGIARALMSYDQNLKSPLRQAGYMTRDPREKERKKPGHKGARKRFQYTKR